MLTGLDTLPPSINLWRHALSWFGGMGIIVLVVAILPLLGVGGMQLYKAETPGPVKDEKLTPRITQTAKALWFVYFLITVACILSLQARRHELVRRDLPRLRGAGARRLLDPRRERRATSTRPPIEFVLIVFMLIAAMNFAPHFIAWQQKSLRTYATDAEAKAMLAIIGLSTLGVALYIWHARRLRRASGRRCATSPSTWCRSRPTAAS